MIHDSISALGVDSKLPSKPSFRLRHSKQTASDSDSDNVNGDEGSLPKNSPPSETDQQQVTGR
jgi:hypothetical protein